MRQGQEVDEDPETGRGITGFIVGEGRSFPNLEIVVLGPVEARCYQLQCNEPIDV